MTSVNVYDLAGVAPTTVRVYDISGAGSAGTSRTVLVYDISGAGTGQPTLIADKTAYDPGELVTITASNGGGANTFAFPAGAPADALVTGNILTFHAPARKGAFTMTIAYNGLAFLTININQAFILVGDTPATIWGDR